jgi:hypothetical protein
MRQTKGLLATCLAVCVTGASGQVITFNGPMPWTTQRNDSITVRAQIDTAQMKKKKTIVLSAVLVNDRLQKTALVKKAFPVNDITGEFPLGPIGKNLAGGRSYVKIEWSIPEVAGGTGFLSPLGIVALDKLPQAVTVAVPRLNEGTAIAAAAAAVKESDYHAAGAAKFAFAWSREAFYIILLKKEMGGTVRFAFDGKNGKNAFLSFADRVVMYQPAKDSLKGSHFSRVMRGDSLAYDEKPWPSEMTKSVSGDKVVLRVPWYDIGVIPFEERRMGMGVMTFDAKGRQTMAFPQNADFFMPGTWCDLVLAK